MMSKTQNASKNKEKKNRPERLEYLDQLVVEFQTTNSRDAKEQILANLANFAYDPLNYNFFRQLNILDLFLDNLTGEDEILTKFSIGGLCNLCLDPINQEYINENGLKKIINLLSHSNEDVVLSAMTTLMFLHTQNSNAEITNPNVINTVAQLFKRNNARLKNLATIFLKDHCTEEQLKQSLINNESSDVGKPES